MPVHDWTRVGAGTFHHFHFRWIAELSDTLNGGLLPPDYYAMAEQVVGRAEPDVLTLECPGGDGGEDDGPAAFSEGRGLVSVVESPPTVRFTALLEMEAYTRKQSTLVIRHSSGDRIVALVEIVSPGNKASRYAMTRFVEKAAAMLRRGYHLLVLDVLPPTVLDPDGIHGALCDELGEGPYRQPPDCPLTLAGYEAGPPTTAFVEPIAVGQALPDMPLFLQPGAYVPVPLEATYQRAFRNVPRRWRRVLEGVSPK